MIRININEKVLSDSISPMALKVYLLLSIMKDDEDKVTISYNDLSHIIGKSKGKESIKNAIRELEYYFLISITPTYNIHGGQMANMYTVL